ncbi:hypothetical protein Aperf_G00000104057 [Anoplocephala perfoliata]
MDENHLRSLGLNVDRLEAELQQSVRQEQRHWHENDAKLRAVEQKVATYDEFRGIVDACELRPLNFKEVQEATKRYASWAPNPSSIGYSIPKINQDLSSSRRPPIHKVNDCFSTTVNSLDKCRVDLMEHLPTLFQYDYRPMLFCRNLDKSIMYLSICGTFTKLRKRYARIDEFIQCWNDLENHQSDNDPIDLLGQQSNELLQEVFASSAGLPILQKVLKCLQVVAKENSASVIRILQAIGSSKNFELTALLMSNEEKTLVKEIFKELEQSLAAPIDEQLRKQWIFA